MKKKRKEEETRNKIRTQHLPKGPAQPFFLLLDEKAQPNFN